MTLKSHNLRDWFLRLRFVDDIRYAHHMGGYSWTRALSDNVVYHLRRQLGRVHCWWSGHDTVCDADPESGYEEVECARCGWSFSCWH
jgi:hypothetical protein